MLKSFHTGGKIEVGIDEVGVGAFAGPVVVGAVIFPTGFESDLIRDSKKLTEKKRDSAYHIIIENAIAYSIQPIQAGYINKCGIVKAIYEATKLCLLDIHKKHKFDHIIMDGNKFDNPIPSIPYTTIIKGDDKFLSIAAASILAKVKHDNYMKKVHELYPHYNFMGSKGYYCKKHGEGLLKYGKCRYHRDKYVETWLNNR